MKFIKRLTRRKRTEKTGRIIIIKQLSWSASKMFHACPCGELNVDSNFWSFISIQKSILQPLFLKQSWRVGTQTLQPMKPKIFTIWPCRKVLPASAVESYWCKMSFFPFSPVWDHILVILLFVLSSETFLKRSTVQSIDLLGCFAQGKWSHLFQTHQIMCRYCWWALFSQSSRNWSGMC